MSNKRRLPLFDDSFMDHVKVASPCNASWDDMRGDDRVRHCGECRLNVYDVSQMTRAEAATLIRMNEGKRTCMRLYRRPDGTLITQDCWERLRAARRRGWFAFAAALVVVALTQLGLRVAALGWLIKASGGQRTMGAIEAVEPPRVETPAPPPPIVEAPPVVSSELEMGKIAAPPPAKPMKRPLKKQLEPKRPEPLMGDIGIDQ